MRRLSFKSPLLAIIVEDEDGLGIYVDESLDDGGIEDVLSRGLGKGSVVIVTERNVCAVT